MNLKLAILNWREVCVSLSTVYPQSEVCSHVNKTFIRTISPMLAHAQLHDHHSPYLVRGLAGSSGLPGSFRLLLLRPRGADLQITEFSRTLGDRFSVA